MSESSAGRPHVVRYIDDFMFSNKKVANTLVLVRPGHHAEVPCVDLELVSQAWLDNAATGHTPSARSFMEFAEFLSGISGFDV
jgi:hypothetical protein